jgi:hypothetical protein
MSDLRKKLLIILLAVFTGAAGATGTLESIQLPPVPKAAWRFTKFPIIAFWGPPGTARQEDFNNYRDAGFSLYMANPDTGFYDSLAKAKTAGLPIIAFRKKQGFMLGKEIINFPENDPAIVGWGTYDEPTNYDDAYRAISTANELMRKDPTRRAFFNMIPPHAKHISTHKLVEAAVRNGVPIISYDNYVIFANGTTDEAQHFAALDLYRKLSLKHDVSFWAFALTIRHFNYRRASESDVRWKQFTNLAYGARGLWYFTYWGPTDWDKWDNKAIVNPADGSKTELYGYVKAINDNVQSMGQTLLNLTSTDVTHTTGTPEGQATFEKDRHWIADVRAKSAIVSFFRHKDGSRYAMIVNKQHGMNKSAADLADDVTLTFAPRVKAVEAVGWLDGKVGPLDIKEHQSTLRIAGGTGVLLKLAD